MSNPSEAKIQQTIEAHRKAARERGPTEPAKQATRGVGARFAAMLHRLGYHAGCGGCGALALKMDRWGPSGCRDHQAGILDDLASHAAELRLFFSRPGAIVLLKLAIVATPLKDVKIEGELKTWRDKLA